MKAWLENLSDEKMPNEEIRAIAELYGLEFAVRLMHDLPGALINVPMNGLKKIRNEYICAKYDGSKVSRLSLAFECEVSEGYIKQLVSKNRKRIKLS